MPDRPGILSFRGHIFISAMSEAHSSRVSFELSYNQLVVGYLVREGETWEFRYSAEFLDQKEIRLLIDFPNANQIYRSRTLWPFFSHRIPSIARPEIRQVIADEELDPNDLPQLLQRFGRRTISNPFTLSPVSLDRRE